MPTPSTQLAPPRHVIRVLHHHQVFDKAGYRDPAQFKTSALNSIWQFEAADYVANGQLHVSADFAANEKARKTLWRFDHAVTPSSRQMLAYRGFLSPPNLLTFGQRDDALWLSTLPTEAATTGYPERPGFDLAPLPVGQPVRVALNARWWHGLASRRQTQYFEWDFVVEYLGRFDHYLPALSPQPFSLEVAGVKLIDLRKELY